MINGLQLYGLLVFVGVVLIATVVALLDLRKERLKMANIIQTGNWKWE